MLTFIDNPLSDIRGVTYAADHWHVSCAVAEYLRRKGLEGHGLSHVAQDALDLLGRFQLGSAWIEQREYEWDSDDFPKLLPHFFDPEICGGCGDEVA